MLVDEAEKLMCPFGGDCVDDQCMAWRWNYMVIGETVGGKKYLQTTKGLYLKLTATAV